MYADVEPVDFAHIQEVANGINDWCAMVTKNHIKDIVSAGLYKQLTEVDFLSMFHIRI